MSGTTNSDFQMAIFLGYVANTIKISNVNNSENSPKILISKISRLETDQECEVILTFNNKTKYNLVVSIESIPPNSLPTLHLQEISELSKNELNIKSSYLVDAAALRTADPKTTRALLEERSKEKLSLKFILKKTDDPQGKIKVFC